MPKPRVNASDLDRDYLAEIRETLPLLVSHQQLSDLVAIEPESLHNLIRAGRGPAVVMKLGRQNRYPREAVLDWMAAKTVRRAVPA